MDVLSEFLTDFKMKLDVSKVFDFAINSETKDLIIELNQSQLYDLGEDSEGKKLWSYRPGQPYSPYTIKLKQMKGQPTDRLTLKDTGDFYKSFSVEVKGTDIILDANGNKADTNLFDEYGINILGLNEKNFETFIKKLQEEVVFFIKNK